MKTLEQLEKEKERLSKKRRRLTERKALEVPSSRRKAIEKLNRSIRYLQEKINNAR